MKLNDTAIRLNMKLLRNADVRRNLAAARFPTNLTERRAEEQFLEELFTRQKKQQKRWRWRWDKCMLMLALLWALGALALAPVFLWLVKEVLR